MKVKFTVFGNPVAKGRPKFARQGPYVRTYTPEKTVNYETLVRLEYERQCDGFRFEKDIPVEIRIDAYFQVPKSVSKKKSREMLDGKIRPTKKPDLDNVCKSLQDGLNGIAYYDDSQIVGIFVQKFYGDQPRVEVEISEAGENGEEIA